MLAVVGDADLAELLPLMRDYCDFYEVSPSDADLLAMSRALIAEPEHEGVQLIARDGAGAAVGFTTIFWSWSTLSGSRIGVMNDLFVMPAARGKGTAEGLIRLGLEYCRGHGANLLSWQTAHANDRARALYERIGARREEWIDYSLSV
jgi:GNAT superfamily N-acetyltransferase